MSPKRPAQAKRLPRKRAGEIGERLAVAIPAPRVELDFADAWQLLVATILAAQSTDKMVNTVTPRLFARWPTPAALAQAPAEEVEQVILSTGFYRQKTQALQGTARQLVADFGGEVPRTLEALTQLQGVGRKTANVVLGSACGIPTGVVVDTHVDRVAHRLRLSGEKDRTKIEADLCALFPRDQWIAVSHRLVLHGRYVCKARSPMCATCPLSELCPAREAAADEEDWRWRAAWEREHIGASAGAA